MNLKKIIPLFLIAMSFTVVTPALALDTNACNKKNGKTS